MRAVHLALLLLVNACGAITHNEAHRHSRGPSIFGSQDNPLAAKLVEEWRRNHPRTTTPEATEPTTVELTTTAPTTTAPTTTEATTTLPLTTTQATTSQTPTSTTEATTEASTSFAVNTTVATTQAFNQTTTPIETTEPVADEDEDVTALTPTTPAGAGENATETAGVVVRDADDIVKTIEEVVASRKQVSEHSPEEPVCNGGDGCLRGDCVHGACICEARWTGSRCNVHTCPGLCGPGESCQNGTCTKCSGGKCGKCTADSCGANGDCVDGECYCRYGFTGPSCNVPVCPTNPACGGHGACILGVCICEEGFQGLACHKAAPGASTFGNLKHINNPAFIKSLSDNSKLLKATKHAIAQAQLAAVEKNLTAIYHQMSALSKSDQIGNDKTGYALQTLKLQALELNTEHKRLQSMLALLELDAELPVARPLAQQQSNDMARELAFSLFSNEHRARVESELKTAEGAATPAAIDAAIAQAWVKLTPQEVLKYSDLAGVALETEQRAWSVAKELFCDEQIRHAAQPPTEALRGVRDKLHREKRAECHVGWDALSTDKRLAYYVKSTHQVLGGSPNVTGDKNQLALDSATKSLAFEVYAQENWLSTFKQLSKGKSNSPVVLAAVDQAVLAKYQALEDKDRASFARKAQALLYPKVFAWRMWQNFSSHVMPRFEIVGFQVGIAKGNGEAKNELSSLMDAMDTMIGAVTHKARFKLIPFDTARTSETSRVFAFIVVIDASDRTLAATLVAGLIDKMDCGAFTKLMSKHGIEGASYFPEGGLPHIVFGSSSRPTCPNDYQCADDQGKCVDGICACADGFGGHDCEHKVLCDCSPTQGLCNELTGRCECYGSWQGNRCDLRACPNDCYGHGMCSNGTCVCNSLWKGADCSVRTCESDCSGHGLCCHDAKCADTGKEINSILDLVKSFAGVPKVSASAGPTCSCEQGYGGSSCGCLSSNSSFECSGHGICYENQCFCKDGFSGAACTRRTCDPEDCHGNGKCIAGVCTCNLGFAGESCETPVCVDQSCSNHGICVRSQCECDQGYAGPTCAEPVCPGNPLMCSGHGMCKVGGNLRFMSSVCECLGSFYEVDCSREGCYRDPTNALECGGAGHGLCFDKKCQCLPGWSGPTCTTSLCPNDCNKDRGLGFCVEQRYCHCKEGLTNADCSPALNVNMSMPKLNITLGNIKLPNVTLPNITLPNITLPKIPGINIDLKLPKLDLGFTTETESTEAPEPEDRENASPLGPADQKQLVKKKKKRKQKLEEEDEEDDDQTVECEDEGCDGQHGPWQTLKECANCCSDSCQEECQGSDHRIAAKKLQQDSNISSLVYSFPDCYFGCQKDCVRSCRSNPDQGCTHHDR